MALVDTDMSAWAKKEGWPLAAPAEIVHAALNGLEAGVHEVYADETTRRWHDRLGESSSRYAPTPYAPARRTCERTGMHPTWESMHRS